MEAGVNKDAAGAGVAWCVELAAYERRSGWVTNRLTGSLASTLGSRCGTPASTMSRTDPTSRNFRHGIKREGGSLVEGATDKVVASG
jgi:hypothetical protein